jgi:hypothetical protein
MEGSLSQRTKTIDATYCKLTLTTIVPQAATNWGTKRNHPVLPSRETTNSSGFNHLYCGKTIPVPDSLPASPLVDEI